MAPDSRWARSASRSDRERRLTTCAKRIVQVSAGELFAGDFIA